MKVYENKMDKVLEQVRNHLARADDPRTPPAEAAVARERADVLMFRYKIDALTAAQEDNAGVEPVWSTQPIARVDNEFDNYYLGILQEISRHCGLRMHYAIEWHDEGDGTQRRWWVAYLVGFDSDVAYATMLFAAAQVAFGKALEPKFDHDETHQQNALRLRRGGMERHRIALILFGTSNTVNEQKAKNRKVTALIKAEAARLNDPSLAEEVLGRGNSIATFRESYARGFYSTLVMRLRAASTARGQFTDGTIVLANMKDRINEAFYERFPQYRPVKVAGTLGTPQAECEKCAKTKSGYCREHAWKRPSRAAGRPGSFNAGAYNIGSAAASKVDLGSPTKRVGA